MVCMTGVPCEVGTECEGGSNCSRHCTCVGGVVCRGAVGGGGGDTEETWDEEGKGSEGSGGERDLEVHHGGGEMVACQGDLSRMMQH